MPFSSESGKSGRIGRAETFRRHHQVGDIVDGFLLDWVGDGLAWVEINGHRLLARTGVAAAPGQKVSFLIDSLSPDIILKPVQSDSARRLNIRV